MRRIGRKRIREPEESKREMGEIEIPQNEFQTHIGRKQKNLVVGRKHYLWGK